MPSPTPAHTPLQCDVAMLTVDDDEFWKDMEPLDINGLPAMQVGGSGFERARAAARFECGRAAPACPLQHGACRMAPHGPHPQHPLAPPRLPPSPRSWSWASHRGATTCRSPRASCRASTASSTATAAPACWPSRSTPPSTAATAAVGGAGPNEPGAPCMPHAMAVCRGRARRQPCELPCWSRTHAPALGAHPPCNLPTPTTRPRAAGPPRRGHRVPVPHQRRRRRLHHPGGRGKGPSGRVPPPCPAHAPRPPRHHARSTR
jgi:hypothetical protein